MTPVHSSKLASLGMLLALMVIVVLIAACERERRPLDERSRSAPGLVAQGPLQPGPTVHLDTMEGPYDDNAYSTAEGQRLFAAMNCSGCHANGGGNMGPALMDSEWIYGSRPDQIFATIAEGRPNGMPAWRRRLNDQQIWDLVAYVRSLSGLTPKGARPSRDDNMMVKPAPAQTPNAKPKNSGVSPGHP